MRSLTLHAVTVLLLTMPAGVSAETQRPDRSAEDGRLPAMPHLVCHGTSTVLHADAAMTLTACHAPYVMIDSAKLNEWQDCEDAIIHLQNKIRGTTAEYADCTPGVRKQFRVTHDGFLLRHFAEADPTRSGEPEPLLIETLEFTSNKTTYKFEKRFAACSGMDIETTGARIESLAKQTGMEPDFTSLYGGFYKLRDCAQSDPARVLSRLRAYQRSGLFDGEVAETLRSLLQEVELIKRAAAAR